MILTYFLCYEESLEFSYYSCWQHTGAMKITKTHSFLFLLDLFLDLVRWDQLVQLLAATGTTSFEFSFGGPGPTRAQYGPDAAPSRSAGERTTLPQTALATTGSMLAVQLQMLP